MDRIEGLILDTLRPVEAVPAEEALVVDEDGVIIE